MACDQVLTIGGTLLSKPASRRSDLSRLKSLAGVIA